MSLLPEVIRQNFLYSLKRILCLHFPNINFYEYTHVYFVRTSQSPCNLRLYGDCKTKRIYVRYKVPTLVVREWEENFFFFFFNLGS